MSKELTNYVVYAETLEEAVEITKEQKRVIGSSNSIQSDCYYRIEPSSTCDRYGYCSNRKWYEKKTPHLPILSFQKWKEMKEGTKYTLEYCKKNKVAVHPNNEEEFKQLLDIARPSGRHYDYSIASSCYEGNLYINMNSGNYAYKEHYISEAFETIDFSELNLKTTNMKQKTLIGYKCPTDLFSGIVKKNSLYVFYTDNSYYCSNKGRGQGVMPKEIVETWEAVYEEEFKVGDWVVVLPEDRFYCNAEQGKAQKLLEIHSHGDEDTKYSLAFSDGHTNSYGKIRKATEEEKDIASNVIIGKYKAEKQGDGTIKFGCQTLTPQDLETVEKLLNSEINATITIHGTKINKELLNRLKAL